MNLKVALNEMLLIKNALYEGYIDKDNPSNTFKALIKYYAINGLEKDKIRVALDLFMKKNYKEYSYNKWKDRIRTWINKEIKNQNPIIQVENVCVTKKELDTISSIGDLDLEKVAFVYLIHSKIYNQINLKCDYWVSSKMCDILQDAKVKKARTIKEQEAINRKLCELGLIKFSYKVDLTNNRVCFASEDDEVVIKITDFREFVLEYLRWKGEKVGRCENMKCGKLFKISGKNHKMCRECWNKKEEENNRRYSRESMRKKRNVKGF